MQSYKVQLLLTPLPSIDRQHFQQIINEVIRGLVADRRANVLIRAGLRLEHNPIASLPHSQDDGADCSDQTSTAVLELFSSNPDFKNSSSTLVKTVADSLEPVVDPFLCAVIAGTEHHILPGWGCLQLVFALRRKPALSREAFQAYWLDEHVHFALDQRESGLRYRQLHADQSWTTAVAVLTGYGVDDFDGVAEVYYQTLEEIRERFSRPEIAGDAFDDEQTFIDHDRSWLGFFRMFHQESESIDQP